MLPEDLKKMIEWEVLHRYSNLENAEDSSTVLIGAIEREITKQRREAVVEVIKLIAMEEAWEESEDYYLDKYGELN